MDSKRIMSLFVALSLSSLSVVAKKNIKSRSSERVGVGEILSTNARRKRVRRKRVEIVQCKTGPAFSGHKRIVPGIPDGVTFVGGGTLIAVSLGLVDFFVKSFVVVVKKWKTN